MTKWVFAFGTDATEGSAEMRDLLGGKGANLAELASLGLPVPPGFDARDYAVISSGRLIGRDAFARRAVSRGIDRLLGRIATRTMPPDEILEELARLLQRISDVLGNEE